MEDMPALPRPSPITLPEIEADEETVCRWVLKQLTAIRKSPGSYATMRNVEIENDAIWIGSMFGMYWYLPRDVSLERVMQMKERLKTQHPPNHEVMRLLGELWLTTKKAKLGDAERDNTLRSYAKRLQDYPPKHAIYVLEVMIDRETFFPPWSDIAKELRGLRKLRATLAAMLDLAITKLRKDTQ